MEPSRQERRREGVAPHILVVDDEPYVLRMIGRMLSEQGYQCAFAGSAIEALAEMKKQPFELVLSDVNMPGGSGLALAERISDEYPDVALVMVTAVDDTKVAEMALDRGAYGYLIKPFERNELLIAVSNALRRRALEITERKHRQRLEKQVNESTADLLQSLFTLMEKEKRLKVSHEETIKLLAAAAEFRDDETAEHNQRMSYYCKLLAERLGLPAERCEDIRLASMMHDVGKIGISDRVLLKPSELTDEEYEHIKTHSNIGYRILSRSSSPLLDLAAVIAWTHHEKFDGSGYPRGLVGEDIPIEGRIAAVADVFDALTSSRVYRGPMSVDEAIGILTKGRGSHFDSDVLDLFMRCMAEILDIKNKYPDRVAGARAAEAGYRR